MNPIHLSLIHALARLFALQKSSDVTTSTTNFEYFSDCFDLHKLWLNFYHYRNSIHSTIRVGKNAFYIDMQTNFNL